MGYYYRDDGRRLVRIDDDTKLMERFGQGPNGKTYSRIYDPSSGNTIFYREYSSPDEYTDTRYAYDKEGRLIGEEHFQQNPDGSDHILSAIRYEYDGSGNMSEKRINPDNGELIHRKNYDLDGNVTSEISRRSATGSLEKTVYEYDENGRLIRKDFLTSHEGDNSWSTISLIKYDYNEEGNMTEKKIDPYSGSSIYRKDYDKDGNVLIEQYFKDGKLSSSYQYGYDENGKIISVISSSGEGENKYTKYEEKYEYDDAGNLVSTRRYDASGNLISKEVAKEIVFDGRTYTFNANELISIAKSLDASKSTLTANLGSIGGKLVTIAGMIQGSGISGAINAIVNSCGDASTAVNKYFTNLSTDITNYVDKTVRNEEETAQNIQEINNAIDEISFSFDGIN